MIPLNFFRRQYSRTRVALVALGFTIIVAALAFSSRDVSSQVGDPQRRDLERVFSRHERLSLDPGQIQEQVKQTRSLTLTTSRGTFEMTLEPHDMRAPGYVAEAWGDNGVTVLERAPVRTYKGTVEGLPGAQARMTIDEQTVEGLIITPGELLFLEPVQRYSKTAAKTDFVFYAGSDVKESAGECGLTMSQIVDQHSMSALNQTSKTGPKPEALFGPAMKIAITLEADFEYFSLPGLGTAAATEAQILQIMNQVGGIYNAQIGLQFTILHTRVWTTAGDPYTSSDPEQLLEQFTDSYNASAPAQAAGRDLAHLWTGRELDGDTIGIAWLPGLECPFDPQGVGYGLSQNIPNNRSVLTAHEIGHNLSAVHVNPGHGGDCNSSVMRPSISSITNFCGFSRDQITTHALATQNCLKEVQPCSYTISPPSQNILAGGGGGSVTVTTTAGCNWAVAEGESWLTVTGGASGTGSGTVNYSVPANNVCGARTAQVNIGGQIHTVQQAGNPNYLTDLSTATGISPGQTLNGNLTIADCPYGTGERVRAFMERYKFNGMAGQKIRIEMNAAISPEFGGLDTYLYLLGPNGALVAENDDIQLGIETNSRVPCANVPSGPCAVEFLTLPQTGTYTIVATSFSEGEAGDYSLTVTAEPLLLTAQVTDSVGTAAAVNSVTFARTSDPTNQAFRIFDPYNFSADQTTRLILFTSDLGLAQQQNPASNVVSVRAGGVELVVEHVGPFTFPGLNGSYVVVALKQVNGQPMPTGSLAFQVTRGTTLNSNFVTLTIAP